MKALDRLRALEKPQEVSEPEPTKLPIPGFVGFVSANPGTSQNFASANDGTARPIATPKQEAELRALLARIAATWSDDDRAEALRVALADPADALICVRALVAELEPKRYARAHEAGPYTAAPLATRTSDDRRTCRDCANLSGTGRCLSAARGNRDTDAGRSGFPIDDLLRRCAGYAPGADDPDRRPGAERWPVMVADAKPVQGLARAVVGRE